MNVELTNKNRIQMDIVDTIKAGRTCYDSECTSHGLGISAKDRKFLEGIVKCGHLSVLEHIPLRFNVMGISRTVLQELSRHRMASYSVKSTRYTLKKMLKEYNNISIKSTLNVDALIDKYFYRHFTKNEKLLFITRTQIRHLLDSLSKEDMIALSNDELKYSMPESLKTEYYTTINFRSFLNFYELRSSPRALEEIRILADIMYNELPELLRGLVDTYMEKKGCE